MAAQWAASESDSKEWLDGGLNKAQQREPMICPPMFFARLISKMWVLPKMLSKHSMQIKSIESTSPTNKQNALAWQMAVYTTY